ncbi:hypothetical protein MTR_5g024750 [Medicago truncatula]|uniref:Uncharacterized protein n=1 Tax=Medicago truncatula TaxID=3880 RepID=G7K2K8_MEDTR|nr:hypothetical protein MTR_5g024750 [Medicago truncatula]
MPRGAFLYVDLGACDARADRARGSCCTRREKEKWIKAVTRGLLRLREYVCEEAMFTDASCHTNY